jgi:hypothetical protein
MEISSLVAGLVAYAVSVVASVLLVFVTYRMNTLVTSRIDEERLLLSGHRSIAVALGSVVLSQPCCCATPSSPPWPCSATCS